MGIAIDLALIAGGIVLLYLGGEGLVAGSRHVVLRLGLSPIIAGLIIISFATSMPEAVASVTALLRGNSVDLALGNVVGSNIANVGLVLGIGALVRPLRVERRMRSHQMPLMLAATLLVILFMLGHHLTRGEGVLLLALLLVYLCLQLYWGRRHRSPLHLMEEGILRGDGWGWTKDAIFVVGGAVALVIGARFLVDGALGVAERFGVPERVIGLTLLAVGTSLPELAAVTVAAARRHSDVAIGSVVGSNVFNLLFIAGLIAVIRPSFFAPALIQIDAWVMLGFALLFWVAMFVDCKIQRWHGAVILGGYLAYLGLLWTKYA